MVIPQDWPQSMKDATQEVMEGLKWADTAVIAQNVYLFAASEGLATGIRALVDRPAGEHECFPAGLSARRSC
jgi:hypothetical protein